MIIFSYLTGLTLRKMIHKKIRWLFLMQGPGIYLWTSLHFTNLCFYSHLFLLLFLSFSFFLSFFLSDFSFFPVSVLSWKYTTVGEIQRNYEDQLYLGFNNQIFTGLPGWVTGSVVLIKVLILTNPDSYLTVLWTFY